MLFIGPAATTLELWSDKPASAWFIVLLSVLDAGEKCVERKCITFLEHCYKTRVRLPIIPISNDNTAKFIQCRNKAERKWNWSADIKQVGNKPPAQSNLVERQTNREIMT